MPQSGYPMYWGTFGSQWLRCKLKYIYCWWLDSVLVTALSLSAKSTFLWENMVVKGTGRPGSSGLMWVALSDPQILHL